ncbi:MAG: 30S ribosomal protein S8, partial [Patescibacteria group bacterium]|nr:30S ribosomal protein S8 [Patescibacteria group bacterium]
MVTDPIADMLIRIKNASIARKSRIIVPYSKIKEQIAMIMYREGYLQSVEKNQEGRPCLIISLKYEKKRPVITEIRRESKPGLRRYVSVNNIPSVLGGIGISILSTSRGIMTGKEAKQQGIGGE